MQQLCSSKSSSTAKLLWQGTGSDVSQEWHPGRSYDSAHHSQITQKENAYSNTKLKLFEFQLQPNDACIELGFHTRVQKYIPDTVMLLQKWLTGCRPCRMCHLMKGWRSSGNYTVVESLSHFFCPGICFTPVKNCINAPKPNTGNRDWYC